MVNRTKNPDLVRGNGSHSRNIEINQEQDKKLDSLCPCGRAYREKGEHEKA